MGVAAAPWATVQRSVASYRMFNLAGWKDGNVRFSYVGDDAVRAWILNAVCCSSPSSVLSVGAGRGSIERTLLTQVARVVTTDVVDEHIMLIKNLGVDARLTDVHHMALGETFDVVLASESVGHFRLPQAFRRIVRHMHAGSKLVLTTYPNVGYDAGSNYMNHGINVICAALERLGLVAKAESITADLVGVIAKKL